MTALTTKHQRHASLRSLSSESVASLSAVWNVRMATKPDHFPDLGKMIQKPQP